MAGVKNAPELQGASSVEEARSLVDEPAVTYARQFTKAGGRGVAMDDAFRSLETHYGQGDANSIRALCWFLKWGR
jgi:hypothetical protein